MAVLVGDRQIQVAVLVQVANGDEGGSTSDREECRGPEATPAIAQPHEDHVRVLACGDEVEMTVSAQIRGDEVAKADLVRLERVALLERTVAVSEQYRDSNDLSGILRHREMPVAI